MSFLGKNHSPGSLKENINSPKGINPLEASYGHLPVPPFHTTLQKA